MNLALHVEDDHVIGRGAVGAWTKADSVAAFDTFACEAKHPQDLSRNTA